ncbi:MAG: hypothetical protein MAG795_00942 [Candidatus Woesearchaeota archaeon]|nr:hypothetical protein [Candidatus Woesearchaeota archaeon]
MHKPLSYFLLFSILLASASASTYNDWILAGSNFTFADQLFFTQVGSSWEMVSLEYDDEIIIANNQSCQADSLYRLCYNGARWDQAKGYGEYDSQTSTKTPEINIRLTSLTPTVYISRTVSETNLLVNQQADVLITLSHDGENKISDVKYSEFVPYGLQITETDGFVKKGNKLVFDSSQMGNQKEISYSFKVLRHVNASWGATMSYEYEGTTGSKESSQISIITIEPTNPMSISTEVSNSVLKLGDTSKYIITLGSEQETKVHDLFVDIPKHTRIQDFSDDLQKEDKKLSWSGVVDGQKVFEIDVKYLYKGSYKLNTTVTNEFFSEIEEKYYNETKVSSNSVSTSLSPIDAEINFMLNKDRFSVGNKTNIKVNIENKDTESVLFDVNYEIESGLFPDFTGTIDALAPGQEKQVYYKEFLAPSFKDKSIILVNVSGSYRTQFYEEFDFSSEKILIIYKDPDYKENSDHTIVEIDENGEETEDNKESGNQEEQDSSNNLVKEEKQVGIFAKIINFFKNLF